MSEVKRSDLKQGSRVMIVRKQDQQNGNLTEGIVKKILTKTTEHPHGIKVMLENGAVGRVKKVCHWPGLNDCSPDK